MSEKRFVVVDDGIYDTQEKKHFKFIAYDWMECDIYECCGLLNEQDKEIGLLRLELDTHKHPLWSTREAERKLSEVTDNLADEVKKNGLLNEEINQL